MSATPDRSWIEFSNGLRGQDQNVIKKFDRQTMNDLDIRVDVYTAGVLREGYPASYPCVVVTHMPTGIVEKDASTPSQLQNKAAAMARVEGRLGKLD
jgi:protein subunit release factor A